MEPQRGARLCACAGRRAAPLVGLWLRWMGMTPCSIWGALKAESSSERVGGGCKQCLLKADTAGSGRGACSNRKAESQKRPAVFQPPGSGVTLLVAMFRCESATQLSVCLGWDWAGAKSCCHLLAPEILVLGTLTRCLFRPWLD